MAGHLRLSIPLVVLTLVLTACVGVGVPPKDVEFSDKAVMLPVPVVMQDDRYDCGVSAVSMLLAYHGHPCDPETADALRAKAEREEGLSGADLEDYLKSEGLKTALFEGKLSGEVTGLFYHLDRGRPLVVALRISGNDNHFVLVSGYDPENDWILLQDPGRGPLVYSSVQFEHAWRGAGNFTLLATPAEYSSARPLFE
jgi:ABC-type bacteriocin/lantibiotic exporter with double-glycine peptidase domain